MKYFVFVLALFVSINVQAKEPDPILLSEMFLNSDLVECLDYNVCVEYTSREPIINPQLPEGIHVVWPHGMYTQEEYEDNISYIINIYREKFL